MSDTYQHIKTGRLYMVINQNVINATNSDDGTRMVLYSGLKRNNLGCGLFVREFNEFHEKFKIHNEEFVRITYIPNDDSIESLILNPEEATIIGLIGVEISFTENVLVFPTMSTRIPYSAKSELTINFGNFLRSVSDVKLKRYFKKYVDDQSVITLSDFKCLIDRCANFFFTCNGYTTQQQE